MRPWRGVRSFELSQFGNIAIMNDGPQRYAVHGAVSAALYGPTRHELFHLPRRQGRSQGEFAELAGASRVGVSRPRPILQQEGRVRRSGTAERVVRQVVDPCFAQACALTDEVVGPEVRAHATVLERKVGHAS